jgi:hypothetical protein
MESDWNQLLKYATLLPNIWQNLIRGHVQMNLWSANENRADKILTVLFKLFFFATTSQT